MLRKSFKYAIIILMCIGVALFTKGYIKENKTNLDEVEPKIVFSEKSIKAKVKDDEAVLLDGITAIDDTDGDVSDSLMIESITRKMDGEYNEFTVNYVAFDSSNNCGHASRELQYIDYRPPHFEIEKALRFNLEQDVDLTEYITATDCIDGDISGYIKISGLEKFQEDEKEGIYECTASVTNSVGDTAVIPFKVEFYINTYEVQTSQPQVILKRYIDYLEVGSEFYAGDYLDYIYDNGNWSVDYEPLVEINSGGKTEMVTQAYIDGKKGNWVNYSTISCRTNIDTKTPGIYKAVYTYTSEKNGYTGTAELILVVEEKIKKQE